MEGSRLYGRIPAIGLWKAARDLGAGLFLITAEGSNLLPQTLGPLHIPSGEGNSQGKLQLLKLVLTLLPRRTGKGTDSFWANGKGPRAVAGTLTTAAYGLLGSVLERRKGHCWLSYHSDTAAKRLRNSRFRPPLLRGMHRLAGKA